MSQGIQLRKYGVEFTVDFELYEIDGVDLRTDWTPAAADCEVMKDGGAFTQCTNTATDEGSTYSIVITATEAEAARIVIKVVDAATKVFLDKVIVVETYGNASAQHAFDLDTAAATMRGTDSANTTVPDAAGVVATALGTLETHGDSAWPTATGFSTHSAANVVTALGTGSALTDCATAAGFSTHAAADVVTALGTGSGLTDCATAAGFSTHAAADVITALGTGSALTDCATATSVAVSDKTGFSLASTGLDLVTAWATTITGNIIGTVSTLTTYTGNTPQTADNGTLLTAVAGYLDTEIAAILAMLDDPRAEPGQGAPAVNPDLATKIDYLYKAWRNKKTQTATAHTLYADNGTTADQAATVSDDTTTATFGEIGSGA